jgi:hypothetical protein
MKLFWGNAGKAIGKLLTTGAGTVSLIMMVSALFFGIPIGYAIGQASGLTAILLILIFGVPLALVLLLATLGLVLTGVGWLVRRGSDRVHKEGIRDSLYRLLEQQRGRVSLVQFASATRLEPGVARQYLDAWARECDATFDVTDEGDIYYVFANYPTSLPQAEGRAVSFDFTVHKQRVRHIHSLHL